MDVDLDEDVDVNIGEAESELGVMTVMMMAVENVDGVRVVLDGEEDGEEAGDDVDDDVVLGESVKIAVPGVALRLKSVRPSAP